MTDNDTDCIKSPIPKADRMLKVESDTEVSVSKQRTSSDLMYCEYVNTSGSEKVSKLFETKKEKPVMVSYGESPFYKKYSDLLKKLEESKDVLPTECDEELPIIEMEVFLKKSVDDDSDSSDADEGRIIFCDQKDDDSTDDETSENDDNDIFAEMSNKVQIISKENEQCNEQEDLQSTNLTEVSSCADNCDLDESCKSVCEKNNNDSLPNYEPVPKKLRLN